MDTEETAVPDLHTPVAVFPLPGVVFFPYTVLPLNIFEPRYREMTRWCLEQGRPMAVALIAPGHEDGQPGDPPIEPIAGLGEIVHHERQSDGRYHLLLRGAARVRLDELERTTPFRQAMATALPDTEADAAELARHVDSLEAMAVGLSPHWPRGSQMITRLLGQTRDPAVLSNCLASALWPDPSDRQRLLACDDVDARMTRVIDRLASVLAEVGSGGPVH